MALRGRRRVGAGSSWAESTPAGRIVQTPVTYAVREWTRAGGFCGRSLVLEPKGHPADASFHRVSAVFDEPNLIGHAGLIPVTRLGERAGLSELAEACLSVSSPNAAVKLTSVIAGMVSGRTASMTWTCCAMAA